MTWDAMAKSLDKLPNMMAWRWAMDRLIRKDEVTAWPSGFSSIPASCVLQVVPQTHPPV